MYKLKSPLSLTLRITNKRTNELRTNTMNTTTTIRSNIFARSCNDDYSPAMADLCVKMRLLSLEADPKLEALDAELERSFYEEKVDLSRDKSNEETFGYDDDADAEYGTEEYEFNTRYGTCFSAEQLDIFKEYAEHTGLKTLDAINYMQSCHACGSYAIHFGNEYCNKRCSESIECSLSKCFNGDDCFICVGYPKTTCYWARNGCDRCDAYSGPEEERYPYECTNCLTQMTDHEGYDVDYELYCNNCAADLFDKTGHLEEDSRKRHREPEEEQIASDRSRDLQDESYDIWELALDINNGNKEAALDMIEDQERLRAHPRIIEYYRAKEASNQDMDFEECSSECSSEDDDLQQRKRARHTHVEDSDEEEIVIDLLDADDEDEIVIDLLDADDEDAMVIDLLSQEDEDEDEENYAGIYNIKRRPWNFPSIGHDSEDDDEEDENYDYAESVVDDDGEVDDNDGWNAMDTSNSVTMSQTAVSSMVTMIQELRDENAALRHELDLIRSQRRMLFPEGSSMSITDEDGQRYINVHPQSSSRGLTMADLDCGNSDDCASDEEDDFEMEEDE
jgi:hypothetical protein